RLSCSRRVFGSARAPLFGAARAPGARALYGSRVGGAETGLLQLGRDVVEGRAQISADRLKRADRRDPNQRGNQTVFDCRCPPLVAQQPSKNPHKGSPSRNSLALLIVREGGAVLSRIDS